MELIIIVSIISFITSLIYHSKYPAPPPTAEEIYRAREKRKKIALFLGATAVSTGYHLVKQPKKRRR